jgi:hypothetical protein
MFAAVLPTISETGVCSTPSILCKRLSAATAQCACLAAVCVECQAFSLSDQNALCYACAGMPTPPPPTNCTTATTKTTLPTFLQTYVRVIAPAEGVLDVPSRVLEFTAVGFCYRIMLTNSNKTGGVKVDIELKEEESWETISGKFFFSVHFAC